MKWHQHAKKPPTLDFLPLPQADSDCLERLLVTRKSIQHLILVLAVQSIIFFDSWWQKKYKTKETEQTHHGKPLTLAVQSFSTHAQCCVHVLSIDTCACKCTIHIPSAVQNASSWSPTPHELSHPNPHLIFCKRKYTQWFQQATHCFLYTLHLWLLAKRAPATLCTTSVPMAAVVTGGQGSSRPLADVVFVARCMQALGITCQMLSQFILDKNGGSATKHLLVETAVTLTLSHNNFNVWPVKLLEFVVQYLHIVCNKCNSCQEPMALVYKIPSTSVLLITKNFVL